MGELLGIVGVNMMQLQSEWLIAEGPARVSSHGYFTD
jgi:hypothetical protein